MKVLKRHPSIIINKDILYLLFIPLIIAGKIVRYTIMKEVLVDSGIGHGFLYDIAEGISQFTIFGKDGASEAGGNAVYIFKLFNIFHLSTYIEFEIAITFVYNIILLMILMKVKNKLNIIQGIFIMLSITVLNMFDFTLAKEPIQMLYFIGIYIVLISKKFSGVYKNIVTVLIILFSAATFRSYYVLLLFFMFFCQMFYWVISKKSDKITMKVIICVVLCIGIVYYILLTVCKIVSIETYTELIRVRTRTSTSASDMRNLLPATNLIWFTLDYLLMLLRMLAPVELLRLGVKYIPYVLYQIMITYYVVKTLKNIKYNSYERNLSMFVYIGFLFTSATFEPDFGSWVRHEAVVLPVLFVMADFLKEVRQPKIRTFEKRSL